MTRRPLKTTTAMVLVLSITQPVTVFAQDTEIPPGAICADGNTPPCAEGVEMIVPEGEPAAEEAPAEKAPADEAQAEEAPSEEAPAEEAPAAEASAEEAPAEEAPTEEAPTEQAPAEEQPAEEAPADEATAEEAAPAEETTTEEAPADETAPADEAPAEEAPSEEAAEAEPATEDAPAEEGPAEEAPAEGTAAEEAPAAESTAEEAPAEEAPEAETATQDAAAASDATGSGETAAEGQAVPLVVPGSEAQGALAEQVLEMLTGTGDPATGESAAPVAAAAAESAVEGQAEGEVTEVEITEEESRQSSEDFATTVSGAARAEGGGRGGLSDLEKAALVGLGILAVGAILSNGDEVVANSGDRVVVRRGENDYYVLKDDDTLLRQPGSTVRTQTFNDGSTRTIVTREDGSKIITIRDAAGRVVRRVREDVDGRQIVLIDDTETYEPVIVERLPDPPAAEVTLDSNDPLALRIAIERASAANVGRAFSLRQVREITQVRKLVPEITLDNITFATGSAAIDPSQAANLVRLGDVMVALITDNPREMFLVEGHTDAQGSAASNLALSDRRAESLALALTEYFGVPPENMVVQGYGESDLKVQTEAAEELNRRVAVRRITPLLDERFAQN